MNGGCDCIACRSKAPRRDEFFENLQKSFAPREIAPAPMQAEPIPSDGEKEEEVES